MIINREMLVVLLRAQRQHRHNMDVLEMQWILHEITDTEFVNSVNRSVSHFMERLAPFMGAEPKR